MILRSLGPLRIAFLVSVVLTMCRIASCRPLEYVDLRAFDYRLRERGPQTPGDDIVVVAIDDASIKELGRWPWSRARMAQLIDRIAADKPAVIGADFVQSEPSAPCSPDAFAPHVNAQCRPELDRALAHVNSDDKQFAEAVHKSGRIVLGYFFDLNRQDDGDDDESPLTAYPIVRAQRYSGALDIPSPTAVTRNLPEIASAATAVGYFNFLPDRDGLYRRAPLAMRYDGKIVMPLTLAMLQTSTDDRSSAIYFSDAAVDSIQANGRKIPVTPDGQLLINFRGPGRTFRHISAADILSGRVPEGVLRDKIVIVGITAIAVGDIRATPFDPVFPGVELHANVIDNILRGDLMILPRLSTPWTIAAELGAIWSVALITGAALHFARGILAVVTTLCLFAAYVVGSQWIFTSYGLVLSTIYPLLGIGLTYIGSSVHHYIITEGEKRRTRRMLDLYLSPPVAAYVSARPEMLKLGGEKSDRTVLFSDIRDFTQISEELEPEVLVDLLNAYLGEMTTSVFSHHGMLDKYIGDAIMAVWGAPLPQTDHAGHACRAALEMMERLDRFNQKGEHHGWPRLRIGIGLSTGPMVFGNMGSSRHLSLTVMGDRVNLGARLEGLSRIYRCPIIASQATIDAAGENFISRELDRVQVKGKMKSVHIYEILPYDQNWDDLIAAFAAGLSAYRMQRWDEALECFRRATEASPNDGPSMLFIERCEKYRLKPPPPDWDGVTVFGG